MISTLRRISPQRLALWLVAAAVVGRIVSRSWIIDDAYITLRMIDNAVNGYGLRWNVAERVQAFTHPLWAFCLFVGYAITREAYFTSLLMALAISALTILLIPLKLGRDAVAGVLALTVLALSRAFVDFSAANLENPLAHLLIAFFVITYIRERAPARSQLMTLSVLAGLLVLVRMDFVLLIGPALLVRLWKQRHGALPAIVAGGAPVALWLVISTIYYGFPFPNTAYAKLAHGVPAGEQLIQGVCYVIESLVMDPLTVIASLVGIALMFRRSSDEWPIVAGVAAYLIYVVRVGGDYMSGRFLAAPFEITILALLGSGLDQRRRRLALASLAIVGVLAIGSRSIVPVEARATFLRKHLSDDDPKWRMRRARNTFRYIIDQRGDDNQTGLFAVWRNPNHELVHPWIDLGRSLKQRPPRPFEYGAVGLLGFYAGPAVHVIDSAALGEPLLARLPATRPWFVGHYDRRLPPGYFETLEKGANVIADPNVRTYYDELKLVTRGPIWSWARFKAIVRLNLRLDNYLLQDYGALDADATESAGAWWFQRDEGVDIWERGLRLHLRTPSPARKVILVMRDPLRYELRYFSSGKLVATQFIDVPDDTKQSVVADVAVPPGKSFDRVDLILANDGMPATVYLLRFQ